MNRESRLRCAKDSEWVSKYAGKNLIKGYGKWFGVDLITSVIELRMLGVQIDSAREAQIRASVESRAESRRRSREAQTRQEPFDEFYTDFGDSFETSWLFSSTIRDTIKSKLDASVVDQLEKARLKAPSALSSVQIAEHVKLTGAVKSLSLGAASVLTDRLSVQVVVQGESSVSLK